MLLPAIMSALLWMTVVFAAASRVIYVSCQLSENEGESYVWPLWKQFRATDAQRPACNLFSLQVTSHTFPAL